MKIIDTNLPEDVIKAVERHLDKAETKHPVFAYSILPPRIVNIDTIKELLKDARISRDESKSVYDVLREEFYEIFEAVAENKTIEARSEIYDTIAVLLRLDKVLQEKQRNELFHQSDIPVLPSGISLVGWES